MAPFFMWVAECFDLAHIWRRLLTAFAASRIIDSGLSKRYLCSRECEQWLVYER